MTTEQMKELHDTGKWICVYKPINEIKWATANDEGIFDCSPEKWDIKLIHVKHKEVLDHVLSGGLVKFRWYNEPWMDFPDFIENYEVDATYEIIPKKQTCTSYTGTGRKDGLVMCNTCNKLVEVLEHFHTKDKLTIIPKKQDSKPPKRITREEWHVRLNPDGDIKMAEQIDLIYYNISRYYEHLEANQRG